MSAEPKTCGDCKMYLSKHELKGTGLAQCDALAQVRLPKWAERIDYVHRTDSALACPCFERKDAK